VTERSPERDAAALEQLDALGIGFEPPAPADHQAYQTVR
jgi:hypothetical protein